MDVISHLAPHYTNVYNKIQYYRDESLRQSRCLPFFQDILRPEAEHRVPNIPQGTVRQFVLLHIAFYLRNPELTAGFNLCLSFLPLEALPSSVQFTSPAYFLLNKNMIVLEPVLL